MLELVRYQKKELKQVAGAEEIIYTVTDMIRMERANQKKLGALADVPVYSIPYPIEPQLPSCNTALPPPVMIAVLFCK